MTSEGRRPPEGAERPMGGCRRDAGQLDAGAGEYRGPVLGLIFLAYAEHRFEEVRPSSRPRRRQRRVTPDDYRARSVLFVPDEARLSHLVDLPEGEDLGKAIDDAMKAIEAANPELRDVLPRGYQRLEKSTLIELLRLFAPLPRQAVGRRVRADLRGLPVQLRHGRGPARRRVLHAVLDRPADRRDHRAVPRQGLRPGLRVGRHVRPVRQVRRAPRTARPPESCRSTARSRRRSPSRSPR